MASPATFLTIIISTIFASTSGFKIERSQPINTGEFSTSTGLATPSLVRSSAVTQQPVPDYRNQPIAGYPKVPPPNAQEAGGNEEDLLPPLEDSISVYDQSKNQFFRRSIEDVKVDPKTGYPLVAEPSWKYSGGNDEDLELPIDDSENTEEEQAAIDPKTGYPLFAKLHWKDAGGNEEIISLPFEDTEENFGKRVDAVDPKTGYPLEANPSWKDAGGNEEILELPLEDPVGERFDKGAIDPKTGYPLVAQESWKDAGGDEKILELPLEEPNKEAIDPKTGYALVAQPFWKDAGGDGDILKPPLENTNENPVLAAVDPKTGYPLTAQPEWKDAGGNADILQLPLEDTEGSKQALIDSKTGYPLIAQPSWKDAGGDGDILQLPLRPSDKVPIQKAIDPKTRYPLIAYPEWKNTGKNEDIPGLTYEQPTENSPNQKQSQFGGEYDVFEILKLTELQPPALEKNYPTVFSNSFSTPSLFARKQDFPNIPSSGQNHKMNSMASQTQYDFNNGIRPVGSSYTNTGPENMIVTATRFLSTDKQEKQNYQPNNQQRGFLQNGFNQNEHFRSSITGKQALQNNFQRPFNFHNSDK